MQFLVNMFNVVSFPTLHSLQAKLQLKTIIVKNSTHL